MRKGPETSVLTKPIQNSVTPFRVFLTGPFLVCPSTPTRTTSGTVSRHPCFPTLDLTSDPGRGVETTKRVEGPWELDGWDR